MKTNKHQHKNPAIKGRIIEFNLPTEIACLKRLTLEVNENRETFYYYSSMVQNVAVNDVITLMITPFFMSNELTKIGRDIRGNLVFSSEYILDLDKVGHGIGILDFPSSNSLALPDVYYIEVGGDYACCPYTIFCLSSFEDGSYTSLGLDLEEGFKYMPMITFPDEENLFNSSYLSFFKCRLSVFDDINRLFMNDSTVSNLVWAQHDAPIVNNKYKILEHTDVRPASIIDQV